MTDYIDFQENLMKLNSKFYHKVIFIQYQKIINTVSTFFIMNLVFRVLIIIYL